MDVLSVAAAIRNHFLQNPRLAVPLPEVHELWNPWPNSEQPLYLTQKALEMLERDGFLDCAQANSKQRWRAWH
jgi:hypothetical protein